MASLLVFVIAFAVGCLSGVVFALWSPRRRADRSHGGATSVSAAEGHTSPLIQHTRDR
jgi:hypothetical protein